MKKLIHITCIASIFLLGITVLPAQTSKRENIKTTHFTGEPITGIKGNGQWQIVIRQGAATGVELEIDPLLEPYMTYSLNGGILTLSQKELPEELTIGNNGGKYKKKQTVCNHPWAIVTLNSLDKLNLSGISRCKVEDTLSGTECRIDISGLARVLNLPLYVQTLQLTQSGVSKITNLAVNASGDISVNISGVSKLSETSLRTQGNLAVTVSGTSSVCSAIDVGKLAVKASGVCEVELSGKAVLSNFSSSGVCKVNLSELNKQ